MITKIFTERILPNILISTLSSSESYKKIIDSKIIDLSTRINNYIELNTKKLEENNETRPLLYERDRYDSLIKNIEQINSRLMKTFDKFLEKDTLNLMKQLPDYTQDDPSLPPEYVERISSNKMVWNTEYTSLTERIRELSDIIREIEISIDNSTSQEEIRELTLQLEDLRNEYVSNVLPRFELLKKIGKKYGKEWKRRSRERRKQREKDEEEEERMDQLLTPRERRERAMQSQQVVQGEVVQREVVQREVVQDNTNQRLRDRFRPIAQRDK